MSLLDTHPVFSTMPVEVKHLPDGTEIRNYVDSPSAIPCFDRASASSYSPMTVERTDRGFCSTRFAVCNNQFFIRGDTVIRYVPLASGGGTCFINESHRPVTQ